MPRIFSQRGLKLRLRLLRFSLSLVCKTEPLQTVWIVRAESDILRFEEANAQVTTANWFVGVLLGLGATLFYLIMYFGLAVLVSTLALLAGVPIAD